MFNGDTAYIAQLKQQKSKRCYYVVNNQCQLTDFREIFVDVLNCMELSGLRLLNSLFTSKFECRNMRILVSVLKVTLEVLLLLAPAVSLETAPAKAFFALAIADMASALAGAGFTQQHNDGNGDNSDCTVVHTTRPHIRKRLITKVSSSLLTMS